MLVEIHVLQNHAPSNLNRDDTGSPKSCIFGGIPRSRISSQCLKRSIRQSEFFSELMNSTGKGIRTRKLPELVKNELIKDGIDEKVAEKAAQLTINIGKKIKDSKKTKKSKEKEEKKDLITPQIMFFSSKELQKIIDQIKSKINDEGEIDLDVKSLIKGLKGEDLQPITPDMALFGRMITGDAFINIDASVQVAHAISTNKIEREFDYFTAIDDLSDVKKSQDEQGAAMIGDIEFNSSCYYKYFSLDTEGFLENIAGSGNDINDSYKKLLNDVIDALVKSIIFVTPSGKQNSFAAHQLPDAMLVEIRQKKIPISYANAFIKPCFPSIKSDLMENSLERFKEHTELINNKFSLEAVGRYFFSTSDMEIDGTEKCEKVEDLLKKLSSRING